MTVEQEAEAKASELVGQDATWVIGRIAKALSDLMIQRNAWRKSCEDIRRERDEFASAMKNAFEESERLRVVYQAECGDLNDRLAKAERERDEARRDAQIGHENAADNYARWDAAEGRIKELEREMAHERKQRVGDQSR